MDIKVIESSGNNEWDSELKKINASIFLTHAWLDAINSKESKPLYLKFLAVNEVVGFIAGLIRPVRKSSRKQLFFTQARHVLTRKLHYLMSSGMHYLIMQRQTDLNG